MTHNNPEERSVEVEEFSKKWHELGIPNGCLPDMQAFVAHQLQKAREEGYEQGRYDEAQAFDQVMTNPDPLPTQVTE